MEYIFTHNVFGIIKTTLYQKGKDECQSLFDWTLITVIMLLSVPASVSLGSDSVRVRDEQKRRHF